MCGRCGLRVQAQYNNNGHAARYVCQAMKSSYGDPFCQSLEARPLDDLITRLMLEAMTPAAIEASIALAMNLEAERAAVDRHWRQRLERAGYEVERARRQYTAVEPENRLVARTLERAWEAALSEQAQLQSEYERMKRMQPQAPSAAELLAIRELTHGLPMLWRAETTTQAERQTIARLLLERVLVEVVANTERVGVECHWHGGSRTAHALTRPVARLATLSLGLDRLLKSNTSKRRTHSPFRQGCLVYDLTPNMPEHRLRPPIAKYAELLSQNSVFTGTFGLV